jgi:hypothetical protein
MTGQPGRHVPYRPKAVAQPGVHRCPVDVCPLHVSPGHVVCRTHWRQIPSRLRDPLREAFRNRTSDPAGFAAAVEHTAELAQTYARRTA